MLACVCVSTTTSPVLVAEESFSTEYFLHGHKGNSNNGTYKIRVVLYFIGKDKIKWRERKDKKMANLVVHRFSGKNFAVILSPCTFHN